MRGGGMRGGMDPEAMQQAMAETRRLAATPRQIGLDLSETSTSILPDGGTPLALELDHDPVPVFDGTGEIQASAKWTKRGLEIFRKVPNGGEVLDRYQVDEAGLLVLRREVTMMEGRPPIRVKLVYRRTES